MKKIFIVALSVAALALSSCADFLNTSPQGSPTSETFFQNDDQAKSFAKNLYQRFSRESYYGRNVHWEQIGANDFLLGRNYSDRYSGALLTITGDDGSIAEIYRDSYSQISNCQWGIKVLEAKKAEKGLTEVEERTLGEAYFFRALYHFVVASRHGLGTLGVPFKPWEEYENGYNNEILPQLESVVDNYLYIIADFKKAEEYLPWKGTIMATYPSGNDRGRVHKVSAIGYQAKVWAYMATWKSVCDEKGLQPWAEVEKIVNRLETPEFGRGLNESFSDLWSSDFAKFWNKECVFSVACGGGSAGMGGITFPGTCLDNKGWGKYNGYGQFKPSYDIVAEMEKDNWDVDENGNTIRNERLTKSVFQYGDYMMYWGEPRLFWSDSDTEAGFMIAKYFEGFTHADPIQNGYVHESGDGLTTRINFHILRFADLMLLRAEACLHLYGNDKYGDIAKVHKRSTGGDLNANPSWGDLYHERRCELAFEFTGHLEDIKRWTVMKNQGQSIGALGDLAYEELMSHPTALHAKLSPMYGLLTDKAGKYIDDDKDGKVDAGPLYVKISFKADGTPDYEKSYQYVSDNGKGIPVTASVQFNGYDEKYGWGLVDGEPVVYYGSRNNPGAELEVIPYADYNLERPEWNDNMLAIPYPTAEINKAGGLYKQVPR